MELKFKIDKSFINAIKEATAENEIQIAEDALTLLNWAIEEAKEGRSVVSIDNKSGDLRQLQIPSLSKVIRNNLESDPQTTK